MICKGSETLSNILSKNEDVKRSSESKKSEGIEVIAIKRENAIKPRPTNVIIGPRLFIIKIIKLKPLLIYKKKSKYLKKFNV
jgi:hypothetical protein